MAKGSVYPSESSLACNSPSGVRVRQVTAHPSIHHHPFYYLPAYDKAMRWLIFISHRSGAPQIFAEERSSGRLVQLTERSDLNEWSIHPSYDGRFVYFTAGTGAWRVSLDHFKEECLADFGDVPMIPPGMVGDAMGTTSLSTDDQWWAVPVKVGANARLHLIDTRAGACTAIVEAPSIGHPQFHPRDPHLLRYAGPYHSRLWVLNRDGSEHRLVYRRDAARKEWIVHEVWHPLHRELLAVRWPHGVIGVDVDAGTTRRVCSFNAWHAMIRPDGRLMVADTNFPDRGLRLFAPERDESQGQLLCEPKASNAGAHWGVGHCPYDDGPVTIFAPQHTHPHPNFSPDGRRVVFTSDCTGESQIYEVELPPMTSGDRTAH